MFRPYRCVAALALFFVAWPVLAAEKSSTDEKTAVSEPPAQTARVDKDFRLLDGFQAELIYSVPKKQQGSWVNMAVDPQGRLITSDQNGKLYCVTPPPVGDHTTPTKVEPIELKIGAAQGLLYAFGSLYVNVNGNVAHGSGLYRLRDPKGDGHYDRVELLHKLPGGGEHGPHAVVLAPDKKSLLVVAGNFTDLPELASSRVPQNWDEDLLIGRQPDARGFGVGRMAPGGWICRTDPDGKELELYSVGYRNPFDCAVSPEGEIFTYDADMEWDIGLPWYRPTRVCHVVSGSEFGWRNGSGKWPAYYPDTLPSVVDIGFGSPTGMTFGTGAKFPARYQRALLACDWSYGKLYAIHLTPAGSSYTATFETFAAAAPLPLTDIVVNPRDGAVYFTVGGRSTDSALYRITYIGPESTAPVKYGASDSGTAARRLRHRLEALQVAGAPHAVDTAWPYLGNPDLFLRYAARIAIEHQPVKTWQKRALDEQKPEALITALVALARCGHESLEKPMIAALGRVDFAALSENEQLALLRAYGLIFIRMGRPDAADRGAVLSRLDAHYPAATPWLNRELGDVLVYLDAPHVVARSLKLLAAARTQEEQIQYIFMLRNLTTGWTLDQRRTYFEWFAHAGEIRGGASFDGYLVNIRQEALDHLTDKVKVALKETLDKPTLRDIEVPAGPPRKFVRHWTTDEVVRAVQSASTGRNFVRGQSMFVTASCVKCHRFQGAGGSVGPDLSGVGRRFSVHDVVESITEPDKVVSDQYQMTIFELSSGKTIVGRVANYKDDHLMVMTDMLDPGHLTNINRKDIEHLEPSKVSPMPGGLLDTFSPEEIVDLVAYLRSGGNPADPIFARPTPMAAAGDKQK